MGFDAKIVLKNALKMAVMASEVTPNQYDDIIVKAATKILFKVFNLDELENDNK